MEDRVLKTDRKKHKELYIEPACVFCSEKGVIEGHHLIPQKFMGDWVPYGTIDVCKSCHGIIDDITRCYIYRPIDDKGDYVVDAWERRKEFAKELKTRSRWHPQTMTPFDQRWLMIYNYFMETVVPLWETHRKKTISQIIGLDDEGESLEVLPAEAMVKDIKHWWEVPTVVLENYVDAGLGDPRKAKWRLVVEGKRTYYQVAPRES